MSGWDSAHLSEIGADRPSNPDNPRWLRIRKRFGIESFGINAWRGAAAGDRVIEEHDEVGAQAGRHEELYFVVSGRATFTVDGEDLDGPTGTFVFVGDPELKRSAIAAEPDTTVLAMGGKPGEPFAVSAWEKSSVALDYFERHDYAGAKAILATALAEHPDSPGINFNLACAESLLGEQRQALEHLRRAVELDERFREYARRDSDLDPLRAEPEFSAIAGEPDPDSTSA